MATVSSATEALPVIDLPFAELSVGKIKNYRKTDSESESFQILKNNIKANGLLQNLVVWVENPEAPQEEQSYHLTCGFRRYQAIQQIRDEFIAEYKAANNSAPEEDEVPFSVISVALFEGAEEDAGLLNATENFAREDLSPSEQVKCLNEQHLFLAKRAHAAGKKQGQRATAERLGVAQSTLSWSIRTARTCIAATMKAWDDGAITKAQVEKFAKPPFAERGKADKYGINTYVLDREAQKKALEKMLKGAETKTKDKAIQRVAKDRHVARIREQIAHWENQAGKDGLVIDEKYFTFLKRMCSFLSLELVKDVPEGDDAFEANLSELIFPTVSDEDILAMQDEVIAKAEAAAAEKAEKAKAREEKAKAREVAKAERAAAKEAAKAAPKPRATTRKAAPKKPTAAAVAKAKPRKATPRKATPKAATPDNGAEA